MQKNPFNFVSFDDKMYQILYSSNEIRKTCTWTLSKFEQSAIVNLMPISWLFWIYTTCFLLLKLLELVKSPFDAQAYIWEKAISILAGNLNLGRSYLITSVHPNKKLHNLPDTIVDET